MIYYTDDVRLAGPQDVERIRSILTDPAVSGTFGPLTVEGLPWESAFEDLAWFVFPGGVFAAEIRADRSAWVHVAVLPWARGRPAVEAARQIMARLFKGGVTRICGWTPASLRAARYYNVALGFTPRKTVKGHVLYVMKRKEWESHVGK